MRTLLLVLGVSLVAIAVTGQNQTKSKIQQTLRSAFTNCRQGTNPGMVVVVVKEGQVVTSQAFGVKDLGTKQPMTTSTQLGIGSLTKIFANLLIQKYFGEDSRYDFNTPSLAAIVIIDPELKHKSWRVDSHF